MKLAEKIFQMFICGTGQHLDYSLRNNLGGVIFFERDIHSKTQFIELVNNIKTKSNTFPFLSIDQEGGRVERTKNIHTGYLSPKEAFVKGEVFLKKQTVNIANELNEFGLNMNFAPCLDVNSNPNNPIIGDRAFSNKTEDVIKGYDCTSSIYSKNGIIPVIKHFPGHGDADKDSHMELPKIGLTLEEMEKVHILPFKHAIQNNAEAIMVAHLHCCCFDKNEIPTTLSKNCIDYLRYILKFKGVIISDDMYMKGLAKYGLEEACVLGIKAGLNMFIFKDSSDDTLSAIEYTIKSVEKQLDLKELVECSYNKIIDLKKRYNIV